MTGLAEELARLHAVWQAAPQGAKLKAYGPLEDALIDNLPTILAALSPPASEAVGRITPEWCLNMAELEGDEVGAGAPDHPLRCPSIEVPSEAVGEAVEQSTNLPVSQEARQAAVSVLAKGFNTSAVYEIGDGDYDDHPLVQAFQRAITQAAAAGYRRGVDEILCDAINDLDVLDRANLGDDRGFRNRAMMLKESHKRRLSAIRVLNQDQTDES